MNQLRAQQLIVGSLATAAVVSAGSAMAQGDPLSGRLVLGYAFTGLGLATAAMFAPALASSFAVLVLTSSVFLYGAPLYEAVTTRTSSPNRTTRNPRKVVPV